MVKKDEEIIDVTLVEPSQLEFDLVGKEYILDSKFLNVVQTGGGSYEKTSVYTIIQEDVTDIDTALSKLDIPNPEDGDMIVIANSDKSSVMGYIHTTEFGWIAFSGGKSGEGCDCTYTNPKVEQNVGNVKIGESFDKETIQQVLDRIFAASYAKPQISIGLSTPKNVYDKDTETISSVTITANVTRKSEDLAYVKFYADGVVIETITAAAAAKGGTFKYTYTPAAPINKTTTFKVETCDVTTKSVVSTQAVVTFVQKSYYGVMSSILDYTDPDLIVLLNNKLNTSVGMSQKFSCEYGRFLYAHPTAIGTVSSIKDNVNNFNYTDSCQKINITINGGKYELVYLVEPAGFEDLTITFA